MADGICPVCNLEAKIGNASDYGRIVSYTCPRCGTYEITGTVKATIEHRLKNDAVMRARVSHALRRAQHGDKPPQLNSNTLDKFCSMELPTPPEQADNAILWLGQNTRHATGHRIQFLAGALPGVIGALDGASVEYILNELGNSGLIDRAKTIGGPVVASLTFRGWARFEELTRLTVDSSVAFMAMPFGDDLLERMFADCFRPASKLAGFDLRRINDPPVPAGLIDNRLRVEIRRSKFLLAELTNANCGAYWEAGFAEGLGRPVIYTCEKTYFDEHKMHFDTNHCHTVIWQADRLDAVAEELTTTIRATLPADAKMMD